MTPPLSALAARHTTCVRQAALGLLVVTLLALPAARAALELSMWRHMVLQAPLWMLAGALLAGALDQRARASVARWNADGTTGLLYATLVLALLMVPRVLDLALVRPAIEAAKCAALVLAGAALRQSWRPAGLVVQGFFLGNVLPMTAVVGQLYIDSPIRVCNAYLLDGPGPAGPVAGHHCRRAGHALAGAGPVARGAQRRYRTCRCCRRRGTSAVGTAAIADARLALLC